MSLDTRTVLLNRKRIMLNTSFVQSIIGDIAKTDRRAKRVIGNVTKKDIVDMYDNQDGLCTLSGEKLYLAANHRLHESGMSTLSVDRIDSNGLHNRDNLQLVHKIVNQLKSDHVQTDFVEWCCKIADYSRR